MGRFPPQTCSPNKSIVNQPVNLTGLIARDTSAANTSNHGTPISSTLTYALVTASLLYLYCTNVLHLSDQQMGFLFGVTLLANRLFAVSSASLGQWVGLGKAMIIGCLMDSLSFLLFAVSKNYGVLVLAVIGVGGALFSTNAHSALLHLAQGERSRASRWQSPFASAWYAGSILSAFFGYLVIKNHAHIQAFWICSAIEALMVVAIMAFTPIFSLKSATHGQMVPLSQVREVVLSKEFMRFHLYAIVPSLRVAATSIIFPFMFESMLHTPTRVPWTYLVEDVFLLVSQSYAGAQRCHG